jgi:hypothetical protein
MLDSLLASKAAAPSFPSCTLHYRLPSCAGLPLSLTPPIHTQPEVFLNRTNNHATRPVHHPLHPRKNLSRLSSRPKREVTDESSISSTVSGFRLVNSSPFQPLFATTGRPVRRLAPAWSRGTHGRQPLPQLATILYIFLVV